MRHWMRGNLLILLIVALFGVVGCAQEPVEEPAEMAAEDVQEEPAVVPELRAKATLEGLEGSDVSGAVTFFEANEQVKVVARVENVSPGVHGFHIHETGDCSADDFTSAGGHFAPDGNPHGAPTDEKHHAGDLGNITVGEDGVGNLEITSEVLTVSPGPHSVVGKAVILHEGEDDLESQPTGDAGARIACGVVALAGDETEEEMLDVEPENGETGEAGAYEDEGSY